MTKLVNSSSFIPTGYTKTTPTEVMKRGMHLLPPGVMIDPNTLDMSKIDLEASRPSHRTMPLRPAPRLRSVKQ